MLVRLAQFVGRVSDRNLTTFLFGAVVMVCFGLFDYFADFAMLQFRVHAELHAAAHAAFVGLGTGFTAVVFLLARRQRRHIVIDELQRVAELNHRLRNSLQLIVDAQHTRADEEEKRITLEAVDAMDETLKQLFPALGADRRKPVRGVRQHMAERFARDPKDATRS
jgi:hypothetical protein